MTDKEAKVKGLIQARKMQSHRLEDYAVPHWEARGFGSTTLIYDYPPNWLRRKLAGWAYGIYYLIYDCLGGNNQVRFLWYCHKIAGCYVAYERIR